MELKQYLKIVRKRIWLIAAIVIVVCAATAVKSFFLTTPLYQANAKLIVNQATQGDNNVPSVQVVQASIMMINSYKEIITSAAILNKVSAKFPDLNVSASRISVSTANNSQVMDLSYVDTSYTRAAKSINAIAQIFKEQIPSIMKVNNVTILNEAALDEQGAPLNESPVLNIVIGFIASLMLAIGLVFLLDYLDNTFKSEIELEEVLGLPTLAVVARMKKQDKRARSQSPVSPNRQVGDSTYATLNQ
ncbi:YveK family protein [Paenibacillus humicola]|uniref:YveK family protein n=1 Tax=Paenibacillus humicola TaxID=3110540 RepID=UPI00237A19F2|nr:Wzz/FepE/Etk N-terminal domain-containing protein [Paenibacillus humicola]